MEVRKSALVPYAAERMFDLIEAAEHYPAFLPWCAGATIVERDDAVVAAEITVRYLGAHFTLATRNEKRRPEWMAVRMVRGPFRRFEGEWRITALAAAACKIEFDLRYELGGPLLGTVAGPVFDRIANTFVDAFVAQAEREFTTGGAAAVPPPTPGAPDDTR